MVTGCAALLGIDVELLLQFEAKILGGFDCVAVREEFGIFGHILVSIAEIEYLLKWTQVFFGIAMAVETPAHRMRLILPDHFHLVHIPVAALAGDASVDMGRVVEIHVIG